MIINSATHIANWAATHSAAPQPEATAAALRESADQDQSELREVFDQFVGQTFYSQLLAAMRSTAGKPAYFHGGRAEEIFQGQLDQLLSERMSEASAEQFTDPMFDLFVLRRG